MTPSNSRSKLGTIGEFALGEFFTDPALYSKFGFAWSDPVRRAPDSRAENQQFLAFYSRPLVTFSYYNWLSEPVRRRVGLVHDLQHFFEMEPAPPELSGEMPWYAPLGIPSVMAKKGLGVASQPAPAAIPPYAPSYPFDKGYVIE